MRTLRNLTICITFITLLLVGSACGGDKSPDTNGPSDENGGPGQSTGDSGTVELQTSDGYTIHGTFVKAEGDGKMPACLLVHQLGRDRSTYAEFQDVLAEAGISSLAIDMRGHGESTDDGNLEWNDFSDSDWRDVGNDFIAGLDYLRSHADVNPAGIGIVGASIGANLAVTVTADEVAGDTENPAACLVLLSPGIVYKGIMPNERARDIRPRPVFIATAREDEQSFRGSQSLSQATRSQDFHEFDSSEHGTELFDAYPELVDDIIAFLKINMGID